MATVKQAFHDFLSNLVLTDAQETEASDQHVRLRKDLSRVVQLDPAHQTFLSGSYARKTAIRPLDDIDMFCVLLPTTTQRQSWTPIEALAYIEKALKDTNPGKTPKIQNRSVNIAFTGTGIAYDVVPAFASTSGFYIPDKGRREWIRSNPKIHQDKATAANAGTDGDLKRLTRAVKQWNRGLPEDQQLRSFLLEVAAWDVLTSKPADTLVGLGDLLVGLGDRLARGPVPEPARLGPNLDDDLSGAARTNAIARLRDAGRQVREAAKRAADGETEAAHYTLRALFGQNYPEPGKPPAKPQGGAPGGSDRDGSRFG